MDIILVYVQILIESGHVLKLYFSVVLLLYIAAQNLLICVLVEKICQNICFSGKFLVEYKFYWG